MADTSSSRPRPKPRPKPKPKTSSSSHPDAGTSATPGSPSSSRLVPSSSKPTVVQDEDDMFIRNRKRSFQTWQKLEEINRESKHVTVDSDEDSENGDSPSRKHRKKRQEQDVPRWQRDKNFVRMLSQEMTSGSDEDVVEILGSTTPNRKRQTKKGKRRSRSRSITPPPALPLHQIQNARNVVRQTLDIAPRAASPTYYADFDDSTDTIKLDPELERIARNITSQAQLHVPAPAGGSLQSTDEVLLSVKWQPHPLNEAGKKGEWQFKMNMDDNFHELFEAVAEEASILVESLIMSYNGKRIFSSVTPQGLKLWGEAELVACDKTTYDYNHKNPQTTKYNFDERPAASTSTSYNSISNTIDILSDDDDVLHPHTSPPHPSHSHSHFTNHHQSDSEADSDADGDKLRLTLRSSITSGKDITLTVRSTTKCGAIVRAFLKKAGVAEQYPGVFAEGEESGSTAKKAPAKKGRKSKGAAVVEEKDPRLCVDGDRLGNDTPIGDMDLEDGDLVEVVGL